MIPKQINFLIPFRSLCNQSIKIQIISLIRLKFITKNKIKKKKCYIQPGVAGIGKEHVRVCSLLCCSRG